MAIPISIIIGLFAAFIAAHFQKRHWINSNKESIRVSESESAIKVVNLAVEAIDKRIAAQRSALNKLQSSQFSPEDEKSNQLSAEEWNAKLNSMRSGIHFFFGDHSVGKFEGLIIDPLNMSGARIVNVVAFRNKNNITDVETIIEIRKKIDTLSAITYRWASDLFERVAKEDFGSMTKINNRRDPDNIYVSTWSLFKELLNIRGH